MRKVIILKSRHFIHRNQNFFLFENECDYNSIKLILLRFQCTVNKIFNYFEVAFILKRNFKNFYLLQRSLRLTRMSNKRQKLVLDEDNLLANFYYFICNSI